MYKKSKFSAHDCDFQIDSLLVYSGETTYKESIELDGIIIDVNNEDNLTGIEVLDVSQKFNISKTDILNIKQFNGIIEINKETIKITMKIKFSKRNKLIPISLDAITPNSMNLPIGTQNLALAC